MSPAQSTHESAEALSERKSLIGRTFALPTRLFTRARQKPLLSAVLVCGSCIILASISSVGYYFLSHMVAPDHRQSIETALRHLDAGEYDQAKSVMANLPLQADSDFREQGYPLFVQGVLLAREADLLTHEAERKTLYLIAARYLEESQFRGFPPDRELQGLNLLATCLFRCGNYAESLPVLHQAVKATPRRQFELYRLLATAYERDTRPQNEKALDYNRQALEDPTLSDSLRDGLLLQQSRIQLALGDDAACRELLEKISPDSSVHDQALVVLGRLLIQEGTRSAGSGAGANQDDTPNAESKFRSAIAALQRAQSKDVEGATTRQSRYLLGICYRRLGDMRAAVEAFVRTERLHHQSDEALAARLAQAEIQQAEQRNNEALSLYLKVIDEAKSGDTYHNAWVPLPDLLKRLTVAQNRWQDTDQYELAIQLSDAFEPIFSPDAAVEINARTHEAWAESLMRSAATMAPQNRRIAEAEARDHFRQAGKLYRQLATLRFATKQHTTDLWKSGDCFLRGQNYEVAIQVLRSYLAAAPKNEHPQGLVGLGESQLALGRTSPALLALNECITLYPKHPVSYRARLLAATAHEALGESDQAKELLNNNLHHSSLTPRSSQWQDSLFAYGRLLYRDAIALESKSRALRGGGTGEARKRAGLDELAKAHATYLGAIRHLDEAVQRYPEAAETPEAKYLIAESYRHAARLPEMTILMEPTQTRRNALSQQRRGYLQDAADHHRELQSSLLQKQEQSELSEIENAILRNTFFSYADALFDLEEYDQAINAYAAATNRYQHRPESLEAFLQIAACYRRLNAPAEAKGTILQAKAVLARMREDADYEKTTRYSQEEWKNLIQWLSSM